MTQERQSEQDSIAFPEGCAGNCSESRIPVSAQTPGLADALIQCIEFNSDHVVWLDADARVVYANRATCEKLEYSKQQIMGMQVWDWDPNFPRDRWARFWQEMRQQKSMHFESEHRASTGKSFPVEITAHLFQQDDQALLFAFARDITHRKQAEATAEQMRRDQQTHINDTQELLNLIMDTNQDLIFAKDKDFRIVHANRQFLSLYPQDMRDKVIGYTTFEEYSKEDAEVFLTNDKIAFAQGSSENLEEVIFPNGEKRIMETRKIRFYDSNQEPYILAVARDVTEKEQLIAELQSSNTVLNELSTELSVAVAEKQALFEAILDSIVVIDGTGTIENVNTAMETLFGFRREELVGKNVSYLMDKDQAQHHDGYIQAYLQTGHAKIIGRGREVIARKKSGALFHAFLSIARFKEGDRSKFVGTLRDISEQVKKRVRLEHEAMHDPLTQIPSRRLLEQKIEEAISTSIREDYGFSVFFIDLNRFKPINDDYGHEVGDVVLKTTATRLKAALRGSDMCARVGGDEFVLLCEPSANPTDISTVKARILNAISQPIAIDNLSINVGASVGFASFPGDGDTMDALVRVADSRMYDEKKGYMHD